MQHYVKYSENGEIVGQIILFEGPASKENHIIAMNDAIYYDWITDVSKYVIDVEKYEIVPRTILNTTP